MKKADLYAEVTTDALVLTDVVNGRPRCTFCDDVIRTGDIVCRVRRRTGTPPGFFHVHKQCWEIA